MDEATPGPVAEATPGPVAEAALEAAAWSARLRADCELLVRYGVTRLILLGTADAYLLPQLKPFRVTVFSRDRYDTYSSLAPLRTP